MKRYLVLLSVAAIVAMLSITTASVAGEPENIPHKVVSPAPPQTSSFTATIVSIDVAARTVVVKDQKGKLWDFVVDPKYGIDLSQYKVGDTIVATVGTVGTSGNPEMRARISKSELLKLQKK